MADNDRSAVVVGSGAGGAVAAYALARAGWEVVVLEKGKNYFRGLADPRGLGLPLFGGDEIRQTRGFPGNDSFAEPRSSRSQKEAARGLERSFTGDVNWLPATVGGATTHWDGKVPRFFKLDFEMLSRLGPVTGAEVADWPFGYDQLAPYYDAVENLLGVAGDLDAEPDFVREQVPRGPYPMPPGPPMYSALLFKAGAEKLGFRAFPAPEAINSLPFDGRPSCHNCGYCSGYGCPVNARAGAAVTFLRRALMAGARLVTRAMVTRIVTGTDGRATHVEYLGGDDLRPQSIAAGTVVLAASAVETARLALRSRGPTHGEGLGNGNGRVGRTLCFHTSTFAAGTMAQRVHPHRGRALSHMLYEPCLPRSNSLSRLLGLPYLRGGVVEIGGSPNLVQEALLYDGLPWMSRNGHKDAMRRSALRDRMVAVQMLGEDLPQADNRVDLDPRVKDVYGLPVARITYSLHRHDRAASWYWGRKLQKMVKAAGAKRSYFLAAGLDLTADQTANNTRHQSGTMRMGKDPATSVTDEFGRIHGAPNVVVCDSSVFPTSGAFNPTLTLMAAALRSATALAHGEGQAHKGPVPERETRD